MPYIISILTEPPDSASLHDISTLAGISSTQQGDVVRRHIQNMLREGHVILTATKNDGAVVGLAVMLYFSSLKEGRVAKLEVLGVHPEHRNQGVGSTLLARCINIARQGGVSALRITSTREHTLPNKILLSHGFEVHPSSSFELSFTRR
ncbi:MAG: Acetyltransferase family [Candidatus Parcubacteria bacterium]